MKFKSTPALLFLVMLVAGIVLESFIPFKISIGLFVTSLLVLFFIFIRNKNNIFKNLTFIAWFLFGVVISKIHSIGINASKPVSESTFSSYLVQINSPAEIKPKTYKVEGKILAIKTDSLWQKKTEKTLLYFAKDMGVLPKYGEVYIIKGSPREIEAPKNPLEFNYKAYLQKKYIYTHQFLREGDFKYAGNAPISSLFEFAYGLNNRTQEIFETVFDNPQALGVANALVAGEKSGLDFETKQSYSAAGAVHILAVSGLHVGILFLILKIIFGKILNPKKIWFTVAVLGVLWLYALFTGLSPSVCRSTFMFTLIQLAPLLKRDHNSINVLLVSAIVLLIINPNWIYDVGFQLSYLAVFGIIFLYPRLRNLIEIENKYLRWLWEISLVSFSAQLLTFPLSLYYFHQFPNYFLFTNPIVAVLSMLILPVGIFVILLFEVPFIGAFLAYIFKTLIAVLNYLVFFISDLKFATTTRLELGTYSVILLFMFIGLIIHFFTRRNKISLLAASVLVLILSIQKTYKTYEQNQSNELTFHYIPRGYGISILDQREANFISSKELIDDPLITQFHLKNYYDHMGIKAETRVSSENRSMLKISKENLKVQWVLDQNAISDLDLTADYLMISNDAIRDLDVLKSYKGQIIIDGSNKKWYIENLQEQNKNYNLNLISLYDSGSKTFKI